MPAIPQILLILKEACQKYGYSWQVADEYSNNLVEVSDESQSFFASNSKPGTYPINPHFSTAITNDKAWCNKILKKKGYKIPEGNYFFLNPEYRDQRGDKQELEDAYEFAKDKYPVFVKPNAQSLGILAEIIYNELELKRHLSKIKQIDKIAIIQELISAPEYRIFAVDGKIQFLYQKQNPRVIGDGKSTVQELIENLNQKIEKKRNKIDSKSKYLQKELTRLGYKLNSILKKGEPIQVAIKGNLSSGASIISYSETASTKTKIWVEKLCQDLSTRVCGIDIFVEDTINNPDYFTIIEVNSSPSLKGIYSTGHQEKALEIWGNIMKKYFG